MLAVETIFDSAGEARVREIWARLAAAGIPSLLLTQGHVPHVSLGACDAIEHGECMRELADFAVSERPLPVTLATVATFGTREGVLFLGVTKTRALLELHERFHRRFEKVVRKPWEYYRPEHWVPHCTLTWGLDPAQLGAAIPICVGAGLPIQVVLEGLTLVEPTAARELVRIPFGRC